MSVNRGKQFENIIKESFEKVKGVSVDRLHDQTTGYLGSTNICDFIVYKKPYEYYIECKTIQGNRFPFCNITNKQWSGLVEKSTIPGVKAGIICWWKDCDVTRFIPIQVIQLMIKDNKQSIRFDAQVSSIFKHQIIDIPGKKKRVFFDYDMTKFFEEVEKCF